MQDEKQSSCSADASRQLDKWIYGVLSSLLIWPPAPQKGCSYQINDSLILTQWTDTVFTDSSLRYWQSLPCEMKHSALVTCLCILGLTLKKSRLHKSIQVFYHCPVQWFVLGGSYSELSKWHEAHEVVPHATDVLQQLVQVLRAHGCCLDAKFHTPGDAIHFHHTWWRKRKTCTQLHTCLVAPSNMSPQDKLWPLERTWPLALRWTDR